MAIKIRQNGIVKDLVINASEVAVLDVDGNFKSKNLETILKQIATTGTGGSGTGGSGYPSDAEFVYVKDTEPDMDGVWLDESDVTSDDSSVGSNSVVKEIKSYVNSETSKINASLTNAKAELEEKDAELLNKIGILNNGVNQISNPNLLINGDFQIWQRGNLFTTDSAGFETYTADRWHEWSHNASQTGRCRVEKYNGHLKWTTAGNNGLRQCIDKNLDDIPLTLTVKVKGTKGDNIRLYMLDSTSPTNNVFDIANKSYICTGGEDIFILNVPKNKYNYFPTVAITTNSASVFEIYYAKLEVGNNSTLFSPKGYGEELRDCQRYYESTSGDVPFGLHFTGVKLEGNYNFSVEKRTAPTVTFKHYSDTSTGKMYVFSQHIEGLRTTTALGTTTKSVRYEVDRAGDTLNIIGGSAVMFGNITADAEIY